MNDRLNIYLTTISCILGSLFIASCSPPHPRASKSTIVDEDTIVLAPIDPHFAPPSARPEQFAFRITQSGGDEINTFLNTITRDYVADPDTTVPFFFTSEQLDSIYAAMLHLDILNVQSAHTWRELRQIAGNLRQFDIQIEMPNIRKRITNVSCQADSAPNACARVEEWQFFVGHIVMSSDQYRRLSEPRSAYW